MRLSMRAHHPIPIYLATLAPRALQLTGRIADGWLGTAFVPEGAGDVLADIRRGAVAAGRDPGALDLQEGGEVAFELVHEPSCLHDVIMTSFWCLSSITVRSSA